MIRPMKGILPVSLSVMKNMDGWSARKTGIETGVAPGPYESALTTPFAAASVPSSLTSIYALWMTPEIAGSLVPASITIGHPGYKVFIVYAVRLPIRCPCGLNNDAVSPWAFQKLPPPG